MTPQLFNLKCFASKEVAARKASNVDNTTSTKSRVGDDGSRHA